MTHSIPSAPDVVSLTQALVRNCTVGANEEALASGIAERLHRAGCTVKLIPMAAGRSSLIARAGRQEGPAICLSGHLDTVAVGSEPWSEDPFGGAIRDGRLYGRGSSDMKGGVAAMVFAMEAHLAANSPEHVVLALSADEETGCNGAKTLARVLGQVDALVIGEPTANAFRLGHKGVLWASAVARGRAAHASSPEDGDNAIARMMRCLDMLDAPPGNDSLLGPSTVSVGKIAGGTAVNIVADHCEAEIDVRLVGRISADAALTHLRSAAERVGGVTIEPNVALPAVRTSPEDPMVASLLGDPSDASGVGCFTDASVLAPALGDPPVLVCGPGDPSQAHVADESCSTELISRAVEIYLRCIAVRGQTRHADEMRESA